MMLKSFIAGIALLVGLFFGVFFKINSSFAPLNSCFKTSIHKFVLCNQNPNYFSLVDVPDLLRRAILTSEDDKFYQHPGIDIKETFRSLKKNLKSKKIKRGGSTITQQLVKNAYLNGDKTYSRKAKELLLSLYIEKKHSKNLLLEKYFNVIEFGPKIYGLKSGALSYFGKNLDELSIFETSVLATSLPAPHIIYKNISAGKLSEPHKKRVLIMLEKLKHKKLISEEEQLEAHKKIALFENQTKLSVPAH